MRRRDFITLLGGATAWPLAARAQQPAHLPVIGVLEASDRDSIDADRRVDFFEKGLAEAGFIAGENVAIEYRWANRQDQRLPILLSTFITRRAAVIFAAGWSSSALLAAKAATATIPIVFLYGGDPVKDGLVASLRAPGGNLTGVTTMIDELGPKRLGLLHEMVPQAVTIGFLTGPSNAPANLNRKNAVLEAARSLGLEIVKVEVGGRPDLARAFDTFVEQQVMAILIDNTGVAVTAMAAILRLAQEQKIPTMSPYLGTDALMSYAAEEGIPIYRRTAREYITRILKGVNPADLPVQQPTKFDLVINLKTARALGLTVPATILTVADKVIE